VEVSLLQQLPEGRDGRLTAAAWADLRRALIGRPNRAVAGAASFYLSRKLPCWSANGRKASASAQQPSDGAPVAVPILAAGHNSIITAANFEILVLNKV
jgi:hypothetical protein